jgi:hypothetical protein
MRICGIPTGMGAKSRTMMNSRLVTTANARKPLSKSGFFDMFIALKNLFAGKPILLFLQPQLGQFRPMGNKNIPP